MFSDFRLEQDAYVWSAHIPRVKINRARLPILLVVSWTGKMNISLSPLTPENLVWRDGFGSPVQRQPTHSPYFGWVPRRRLFIYLIRHTSVSSIPGNVIACRWPSVSRVRLHTASKPQGSAKRVLPRQVTTDQLICASHFHTHKWYEVGMSKVPAFFLVIDITESSPWSQGRQKSGFLVGCSKSFTRVRIFL